MDDKSNSWIEVIDSFKFSDGRLLAFLKYDRGKMSNLTTLEDASGRQWKVTQYVRTTGSVEHYQKTDEEEAQNIFQYLLEGIGHQEKPMKDSKLKLINGA
jgi:hypothetical protein